MHTFTDFSGGTVVRNQPANAGYARYSGLIPGSRRFPGVGNSNLLLYSCLANLMDRGAWQATGDRVTNDSDTTEHTCTGVSVQFGHSPVRFFETACTEALQASLSITNSRSLLKLMSIASVMPSNSLILHRPLLLLPSIFPSNWVFSYESVLCIRWPKYWCFSFSISLSNECSGLISLRTTG